MRVRRTPGTRLGGVGRRVLGLNIGGLPLWRCLCGNDACYLEEEVVVARDWCVWGRVGSETGTADQRGSDCLSGAEPVATALA